MQWLARCVINNHRATTYKEQAIIVRIFSRPTFAAFLSVIITWHIRAIIVLAMLASVVLLIVDSPASTELPSPARRQFAEAMPLLLVGIAYLARSCMERLKLTDLIKQLLIAVAFILWGVTLLMPASQWSRFLGALVIVLYVFDLAWMMEGNLRKQCESSPRSS